MTIDHLDHLVLTVADITVTCHFYSSVMGMQVEEFGDNRKALKFGNQKINLHQKGKEFEPKASFPTPGSADLCFISSTSVDNIIAELNQQQITIIEGPVERSGAKGKIRSVYFHDPDLNLIEVSNYL